MVEWWFMEPKQAFIGFFSLAFGLFGGWVMFRCRCKEKEKA